MLKTTRSPDKPASNRNNGSRSASNRNNNSRPASRKNNGNSEVDRFGVSGNSMEHTKKSKKLFKSKKSKSEKTFKFQNSVKSGKKLSKSGNLINFNTTEDGPQFLTLNTKTAFNHLWLAFIRAPIL